MQNHPQTLERNQFCTLYDIPLPKDSMRPKEISEFIEGNSFESNLSPGVSQFRRDEKS